MFDLREYVEEQSASQLPSLYQRNDSMSTWESRIAANNEEGTVLERRHDFSLLLSFLPNKSEKSKESKEDKESEVAEELVKDVKTKVVEGKGTKGNNKGVVSKAKKQKYVSDSFEEENVSKPKKVYKKKKQVSESSSSYEDEKPLKIKNKRSKKSKKPLSAEQIKKIKYLDGLPGLRYWTVPSSLFAAIRDSQVDMESFLASSYEFKLENGIIRVTPEKVHEILGVPLGGTSVYDLLEIPLDDPFVKKWFKQIDPKPLNKIRACDIAKKLVLIETVDFMFKVNFLMLFANVMGTADTMKAIVNLTILRRIREDQTLRELISVGSYTFYHVLSMNR
uniref:Ulp1 protease family, C-terminal catalytic domain-containing protein n=1 Tax=Tanacetum cinerariifolium TaxID=118510 RepID=A0A6L2KCC6_TANCI|nr:hypothetical protein [Tanacetum cinerariifolium]